MIDTKLFKDRITGLEGQLKGLREWEAAFLEVKGLDKSIETARVQIGKDETELQGLKEELEELKMQLVAEVVKSTTAISNEMRKFLPDGVAIIDVNGRFEIGWLKTGDKHPRPYHALSGGERAIFDSALTYALSGLHEDKIIIIEAGEADADNLNALIKQINQKHPEAQVIINAWNRPARKPQGWNLVEL